MNLKTAIDVDCILSEASGNKNALKIVTSFLFRHPKFSSNEYFKSRFKKYISQYVIEFIAMIYQILH